MMKKRYGVFTILVLSVVLAACSGDDAGDEGGSEEAAPAETGEEAMPMESEGGDAAEAEGSHGGDGGHSHVVAEVGEMGGMLASLDGSAVTEVACASCIYGMDGVEECVLAAKVDGKEYLVTGIEFDTHGQGLCMDTGTARTAKIVGVVHENGIMATSVQLTTD
jgi:hypothetical protein